MKIVREVDDQGPEPEGEIHAKEAGETLGERLHEFEAKTYEELRVLERQIINHHSAAFILAAIFILGVLSAAMIASEEAPSFIDSRSDSVYLSGVVTNGSGYPLAGAVVTIRDGHISAETNEDGYYYMGHLAAGTYEMSASATNHSVLIKKVHLTGEGSQMVPFILEEGEGTYYEEEPLNTAPPSFLTLTGLLSLFIIFTSILSLVGAYYAYHGRRFKSTLVCAAASMMTYGFIAGSILGFFALTFVMLSKNDFDDA